MNVLSLCGPESGIPKNPSVRLLSYSKASEKVSVKYSQQRWLPLLLFSSRADCNFIFPAQLDLYFFEFSASCAGGVFLQ